MICPNCGTMVPEGRRNCLNCGTAVSGSSGSQNPYEGQQGGVSFNTGGGTSSNNSGKKVLSMVLGIVESIIGIFGSIYVVAMFAELDPAIGLGAGAFLFLIGVGLPILGVILVGMNKFRAGGILIIIGSVFFIPIGLIGAFGGRIAFSLADENKFR